MIQIYILAATHQRAQEFAHQMGWVSRIVNSQIRFVQSPKDFAGAHGGVCFVLDGWAAHYRYQAARDMEIAVRDFRVLRAGQLCHLNPDKFR